MPRLTLIAVGLVTIVGQVLLLREISVAFFGIELVYLLALGIWLLLSGLGVVLAPSRLRPSPPRVAAAIVVFALGLAAALVFLRGARLALGGVPGAFLPLSRGLLALVVALAPLGVLSGLLFQWSARLLIAAGGSFAQAYALESVGALLGGVLATWGFALGAGALALTLGVAVCCCLCALATGGARTRVLALCVLAATLGALPRAPRLDRSLTRLHHPDLVDSRDSPYARLTVIRRAGQRVLFINDALADDSESLDAQAFVHPALAFDAHPRRVLVLGGTPAVIAETLRHAPEQCVRVEGDAVRLELEDGRGREPSGARLTVVTMDPRRFLAIDESSFDAILLALPDPDTGQSNRFYTTEFFALAARRLAVDGILALKLTAAENMLSPLAARRIASVDRALRSAFNDVLLLPGALTVAVASRSALVRDPEALSARLAERGVVAPLVSSAYLAYLLSAERTETLARHLRSTAVPANSDARPVCYQQAVLITLARYFPRLVYSDLERVQVALLVLLGAVAAALIAFMARHAAHRLARVIAAGVAGAVGIVLEGVLLLRYQAEWGALFQDVGLLLATFMAGLAVGAWGADPPRVLRQAFGRSLWRVPSEQGTPPARPAAFALSGLALSGVAAAALSHSSPSRPVFIIALALVGAGVGLTLALVSRAGVGEHAFTPLYCADLAGGALGAWLGTLLLIPAFGLVVTAALCALTALLAALALAIGGRVR
jgi:spermidine synthase